MLALHGNAEIGDKINTSILELAKKPEQCLEYVVAHDLMHLLERHHDDRFTAIMDRHLTNRRQLRSELNQAPLAHEHWS